MGDNIEIYDYKGYKINIRHDPDPQNPRTDCDNLTTMACFHKRYNLGDKNHGFNQADYSSWDEMFADVVRKVKPAVIAQLFLYDHSGLRIKIGSFNGLLSQGHAEFDSGPVGFVWISAEAARLEYGWKKITKARQLDLNEHLSFDVQVYDDYLSGSVYGYVIEDANGNEIKDGSCWGFFGHDSIKEDGDAVKQAKCTIDWPIQRPPKTSLPENAVGQLALGLEGIS